MKPIPKQQSPQVPIVFFRHNPTVSTSVHKVSRAHLSSQILYKAIFKFIGREPVLFVTEGLRCFCHKTGGSNSKCSADSKLVF